MLPHSYAERCLACSTNDQRDSGVYVRCRMKKPKDNPRPSPKGQKCGCYVRYPKVKGKESIVQNEIVYCPLHANAPRLLDALEYCLVGITNPNKRVELTALLRECKGEAK